jgi:NADH-quinone oxidoreductase subunit J
MTLSFAIFAILMLAGAIAAMSLRNLVHCALALTIAFAGLAALYLELGAQFVGFAQLLIYVGAVAILIVFAILLTRGGEARGQSLFSSSWVVGIAIALAIFGVLGGMVLSSRVLPRESSPPPSASVRQIGDALMTDYILPLEVVGLLLTAALIGAVIIAMHERVRK